MRGSLNQVNKTLVIKPSVHMRNEGYSTYNWSVCLCAVCLCVRYSTSSVSMLQMILILLAADEVKIFL